MGIWGLRFFGLLATFGLGGCFTLQPPPPTAIQASDNGVFQPVARLSANLSRQQGSPSDPQSGHAIELGFTKAGGEGSQTLGSGQQPVVFGGRSFPPPQQLRYEFDFTYVDVSYRWRKFLGDTFGIEALGGVGYADLDFTVRSPTQRANEDLSSVGLALGVGALWRLRPGTSIQGRVTAFGSGDAVTSARRLELFLVQALGRHAAVRAGYSSWKVESDRGDGVSKLEVEFSGPALGLDVMF